MYVSPNFKTKKALKEAIAAGKRVTMFSPGLFPATKNGCETVEGPHYPEPHRFYCTVICENGVVVKVK